MNTALKVLEREDEQDPRPDTAVYLRARYTQSLERELEDWVRKCQEAFLAGFESGRSKKHTYWGEAFDSWIKERRGSR